MLEIPIVQRGLQERPRDGQPGVVDDDVQPTKGQHAIANRTGDLVLIGHVAGDAAGDIQPADLARHRLSGHGIDVSDDDAGALGGQPVGNGTTDSRASAGHQRDAGSQGLGLGHARQLRLFQRPVLDAEFLRLGDRRVGGDGLRAAHHVDGVGVELAGHARGLLVGAEAEHAHAGDQHDGRIGAAHVWAVRLGVALVVRAVLVAVGSVQLLEPCRDLVQGRTRRQVQHHRPHLGAQEVIWA